MIACFQFEALHVITQTGNIIIVSWPMPWLSWKEPYVSIFQPCLHNGTLLHYSRDICVTFRLVIGVITSVMILFLNREEIFSRTPFDVHGKKQLSSCKHFSQHDLDAFHFNWMNILRHWKKNAQFPLCTGLKPFKDRKTTIVAQNCSVITCRPTKLEICSSPLKKAGSLLASNLKNLSIFWVWTFFRWFLDWVGVKGFLDDVIGSWEKNSRDNLFLLYQKKRGENPYL